MSLDDVNAYYERLAIDETFRTQIESAKSKDECRKIVQAAGYNFTSEEFKEYTAELLDLTAESELRDLDEKEMASIMGGIKLQKIRNLMAYGAPILKGGDWFA